MTYSPVNPLDAHDLPDHAARLAARPAVAQVLAQTPAGAGPSAAVVADGLMAFGQRISAQMVSDISQSLLLATLAASRKVDVFDRKSQWLDSYGAMASKLGWAAGAMKPLVLPAATPTFTADSQSQRQIATMVTAAQKAAADAAWTKLAAASGSSAMALFDHETVKGKSAHFLRGVFTIDPRFGQMSAVLGVFWVDAGSPISTVIGTSFPSATTSMQGAVGRWELNERAYANLRTVVGQKLGNYAKTDILPVA